MGIRKKFSILVMDDSGHVRRFRMRTRYFLCALALCLAVFPLGAALGGWFAYENWAALRELRLANMELEQKYAQARAKAERLGNLETLLHKMNPVDAEQIMQNLAGARALKNASGAFAPAEPEPQVEPPQDDQGALQAGNAITPVNSGQISVEKVVARAAPGHKVRISLDLVNPDPQKRAISGKIQCEFMAANGQSAPLEVNSEMSSFKINHRKPVLIISPIPENAGVNNASVIIEVSLDDGEVAYRNAAPILRR